MIPGLRHHSPGIHDFEICEFSRNRNHDGNSSPISPSSAIMGVQKKTRKFATVKRVIGQRDARLKKNILQNEGEPKKKEEEQLVRNV